MGKARRKSAATYGEDFLKSLDSVALKLEDGRTQSFSIARELRIPDGPTDIIRDAKRAPARCAFWEYQTERALGRVRRLEAKLEQAEGAMDHAYRYQFRETEGDYTEGMVRAGVAMCKDVVQAKSALNDARDKYGILRAIANAARHRCFVLTKLLSEGDEFGSH